MLDILDTIYVRYAVNDRYASYARYTRHTIYARHAMNDRYARYTRL